MKNLFKTLILIVIVSSCSMEKTGFIKDEIHSELKSLDINAEVNVEKSKKNIFFEVSFLKPYRIVDSEQQSVLLSYLIFNLKDELSDYEEVKVEYFLKREKTNNRIRVVYDKQKLNKLWKFYEGNPDFIDVIEFSMKEFDNSSIIRLRRDLSFMNNEFPQYTTTTDVYSFLKLFYLENKDGILGDIGNRMLLVYFFNRDASIDLKGEEQKRAILITKDLSKVWELVIGDNIESHSDEFEKYFKEIN